MSGARGRIDLNVDIGEGFEHDLALLGVATSANVCCGVHAGDENLTRLTVELCRDQGVRVGAHPGFPDRLSMGRRVPEAAERAGFFASAGDQVARFRERYNPDYIKPHGALYSILCAAERGQVEAWAPLMGLDELPVMALPGTAFAAWLGPRLISEGFADRRYGEDGLLVPRSEPDAMLTSMGEVAAQAIELAGRVRSICIHGDTDGCVAYAKALRKALERAGWEIGA